MEWNALCTLAFQYAYFSLLLLYLYLLLYILFLVDVLCNPSFVFQLNKICCFFIDICSVGTPPGFFNFPFVWGSLFGGKVTVNSRQLRWEWCSNTCLLEFESDFRQVAVLIACPNPLQFCHKIQEIKEELGLFI